jgi:hypothetical protein
VITGAPVGASFALPITILNSSLTDVVLSLAITLTVSGPISADPGVPLKVRVPAVKVSQTGSAEPSAWVAV